MMDRETSIKLAHETLDRMAPDDYCRQPYWTATDDELERFAKLVAEHEREACARVAENGLIGHTIAKAIRARGKT